MMNVIKNKIFWIATVIFAVIVFLTAINYNKTYQSSMDVLFLPKSQATVSNSEQIIANAGRIPLSLSFYNKLIETNPELEDGALGLPEAKRKDFWNEKIETQNIGQSGVVRLTTFAADQMQAEMLSRKSADSLIIVMSRYYNIKTDLDMRIIDGPIARQVSRANVALWFLVSLMAGLAVGFFVSALTNFFSEYLRNNKKNEIKKRASILADFSFPMNGKSKQNILPIQEEDVFDFEIKKEHKPAEIKNLSDSSVTVEKKSSAPANLPIMEKMDLFENNTKIEESDSLSDNIDIDFEEVITKDTTREATPEEVKARLNKLLSGGKLK